MVYMKKAIVIGASSGIGKELAIVLAKHGYEVGLMARRVELLEVLQRELPTASLFSHIDLNAPEESVEKLQALIEKMDGVDLIVINSGTGFINAELDWQKEKQTIDVNVSGFCALAGLAYNYFAKKGGGQIVGISSIAALRGNDAAPAYNASKAFMSSYLTALQKKAFKEQLPIYVTDIQPGFVDTPMAKSDKKFWVATPRKAAEQIYAAIAEHKKQAYITHRWRLIAWLIKLAPDWVYFRT